MKSPVLKLYPEEEDDDVFDESDSTLDPGKGKILNEGETPALDEMTNSSLITSDEREQGGEDTEHSSMIGDRLEENLASDENTADTSFDKAILALCQETPDPPKTQDAVDSSSATSQEFLGAAGDKSVNCEFVSRPVNKAPSIENFQVSEGGWGWVCVVAISLVGLLTRGTTSSFALIYQQLRIKFNSTAAQTGWAYSTYTMTNMCFSPLAAALIRRFSPRWVAFCGGCLSCLGITLSGFSTSLTMTYLTFFIAGLGGGMVSMSGPIIINYYFNKKRSLAVALSLMINGVGGAAYAPLVSFLFEYYGYTGTLMILGGLMLHVLAASMVYIVPKRFRDVNKRDTGKGKQDLKTGAPEIEQSTDSGVSNMEEPSVLLSRISRENITEVNKNTLLNERTADNCLKSGQLENGEEVISTKERSANKIGLLKRVRHKLSGIKRHVNTDVLKRRSFALYSVMMFTYSLAMSMNSVVVADFFSGRNLTTYQIAALLSIYGGISIPTRLAVGFSCDNPRLRQFRGIIYGSTVTAMGFMFTIGPLTHNLSTTLAWYCIFGVFSAIASTQESVIIADLLGARWFPDGAGLCKFFRGFGVMLGPTLGGLLADRTGSYNNTYRCAGAILMSAAAIFSCNLIWEKREEWKKNKSSNNAVA